MPTCPECNKWFDDVQRHWSHSLACGAAHLKEPVVSLPCPAPHATLQSESPSLFTHKFTRLVHGDFNNMHFQKFTRRRTATRGTRWLLAG